MVGMADWTPEMFEDRPEPEDPDDQDNWVENESARIS